MLKIRYTFKIPKQNLKMVKLSFLTLNLLWVNLPYSTSSITPILRAKSIKTLMLSPFHYKVAKKNLITEFYRFSIYFKVLLGFNKHPEMLIFNYWRVLQVYFMFIGLIQVQFLLYKLDKC